MSRVLVLCEFSDTVTSAFRRKGWTAVSNDILPTESRTGLHIQGDCFEAINTASEWWEGEIDLIIMHPPCTALSVSGNSTYGKGKAKHVAMENPVNVLPEKATQFIQPYQFGHLEQKKTGLWLHNLPKLVDTCNVYDKMMELPRQERMRLHYLPPSADRGKIRSITYDGIAEAMADQWGSYINSLSTKECA
tara:strand:- start:27 stop:599 length:573 start_codon:yes stop_codon:yes gene_type:complete